MLQQPKFQKPALAKQDQQNPTGQLNGKLRTRTTKNMQRTISVVQSPLARNPAQPTTIKSAGQLEEEDDEWVGSTKPTKQRERDEKDEMGKVVVRKRLWSSLETDAGSGGFYVEYRKRCRKGWRWWLERWCPVVGEDRPQATLEEVEMVVGGVVLCDGWRRR